jgi:elongation factor Ts
MTEINASLVKALRDSTGVGMMDCKKALTETNGDVEAAKEWLRKKGISNASKKSDRVTSEGVIAIAINDKGAAVVELNSETDFVAKNSKFIALADAIASEALKTNADVESLQNAKLSDGVAVSDAIAENIATLGENMRLARVGYLSLPSHGVISFYVHNAIENSTSCGKIGVAVMIESDKEIGDKSKVQNLAKQIGMHIAATKPEALDVASLDQSHVEKEKSILTEQARASGKPENVIEKMIEGRLRKFYEEVVLLEQSFVINPDKKVSDVISDLGKELGCSLKLSGYLRFALGA